MNDKIIHWAILGVLVILAAAVILSPRQVTVSTPGAEQGISVSGQAEKEVMPDKAILWLSVVTDGTTASRTQEQNSATMNAVMGALKNADISEKYIETKNYNLYPRDEWDPELQKSVRRGYRLTHTIAVTTKDIQNVGQLLDLAVKSGVNEVGAIQFTLSDETERELKGELTTIATTKAREKAELLADGMGVSLGTVLSLSQSDYPLPIYYGQYAMMESKTMDAPAPSISPDQVTVSLIVNALFRIE